MVDNFEIDVSYLADKRLGKDDKILLHCLHFQNKKH